MRSSVLIAIGGVLVLVAVSLMVLSQTPSVGDKPVILTEQQAVQTGREFLDSRNYTTGIVRYAEVEEKVPNYYWHELFELKTQRVQEPELCWIIRFEQTARPGHFFEVWLNACIGDVVGGVQCR